MECFYQALKLKNRRIVEHLFDGGMVNHPYEVVATLLKNMVETNKIVQKIFEWDKLVGFVDVLSNKVMGLEEKSREREITALFESATKVIQ